MSRALSDSKSLTIGSSSSHGRWKRISIFVSIAVHVVLLCALGFWVVSRRNAESSKLTEANSDATAAKALPQTLPSPEVTPKQVAATLARATEKFSAASHEEQLNELEAQSQKLESLASPKSVSEIADKFQEWTNTAARATEPATAAVAGNFDFDTAQIYDVLRTAADDGQWNYRTVLLDKEGRTFEVEIDRVEGAKTYATFASLKKFPLAQQVYRQIAMGLIDRALENERKSSSLGVSTSSSPAALPVPTLESPPMVDSGIVDDRDPFADGNSP